MNEQFISDNFCDSEISQMLKEVGFNEPCLLVWDTREQPPLPNIGSVLTIPQSFVYEFFVAAPLYQQVTEWLFEARGISVSINSHKSYSINDFYSFVIHNQCLDMEHPDRCKVSKNSFNTQGEAYKAGILEAIAILKQQNT